MLRCKVGKKSAYKSYEDGTPFTYKTGSALSRKRARQKAHIDEYYMRKEGKIT